MIITSFTSDSSRSARAAQEFVHIDVRLQAIQLLHFGCSHWKSNNCNLFIVIGMQTLPLCRAYSRTCNNNSNETLSNWATTGMCYRLIPLSWLTVNDVAIQHNIRRTTLYQTCYHLLAKHSHRKLTDQRHCTVLPTYRQLLCTTLSAWAPPNPHECARVRTAVRVLSAAAAAAAAAEALAGGSLTPLTRRFLDARSLRVAPLLDATGAALSVPGCPRSAVACSQLTAQIDSRTPKRKAGAPASARRRHDDVMRDVNAGADSVAESNNELDFRRSDVISNIRKVVLTEVITPFVSVCLRRF